MKKQNYARLLAYLLVVRTTEFQKRSFFYWDHKWVLYPARTLITRQQQPIRRRQTHWSTLRKQQRTACKPSRPSRHHNLLVYIVWRKKLLSLSFTSALMKFYLIKSYRLQLFFELCIINDSIVTIIVPNKKKQSQGMNDL